MFGCADTANPVSRGSVVFYWVEFVIVPIQVGLKRCLKYLGESLNSRPCVSLWHRHVCNFIHLYSSSHI